MSLTDWFETWETNPVLLTIATNGLDCDTDRLLAFNLYSPLKDKKELRLIYTTGTELLKSQTIHQITEDDMAFLSRTPEEQKIFLENIVENNILLTYNVPFHYGFVSKFIEARKCNIYDLSIIEQAIRKEHRFYEDDLVNFNSWYNAAQNYYDPLSVKSICRLTGMVRLPSPGQFPLERMMEILTSLYISASSKEILLSKS